MSPPASVNAFLQSIMPSPVSSRSSFTIVGVTAVISRLVVVVGGSRYRFVHFDELVDAYFAAGHHLAFGDRVGHCRYVEAHRANRVVITGNHVVDADRIAVGID